jgi:hypothetical protein
MKVRELINELEEIEDDQLPVHFAYQYGDHWRTVVAPEVTTVEEGRVTHSGYHNMDKQVDEEDKGYDQATEVVIIH